MSHEQESQRSDAATQVLDQDSVEKRIQFKESLVIHSRAPQMNRDLGLEAASANGSIIWISVNSVEGFKTQNRLAW